MSERLVDAINAVYGRFVEGGGAPTISAPIQSDLEAILWNLAGADVDLPIADTGLEGALADLAEHADEIGGGGDNNITITLNVTSDGGSTSIFAQGLIDGDGYLHAAYKDGTGLLTDFTEVLSLDVGTHTEEFFLVPNDSFQFGVYQGTVTSVEGAAVYNAEASEEAEVPVYDISGDCTFAINGGK